MAFTIGCHDQLSFDQTAVKCDHPYAGPLENRIYTTQNGTTWSLTGKIRWDKNLVRWKSKVQLDQERGYVTRRYLTVYLNRRAIHSNSLEDEYLANATVSTRSTLALINAVSFRARGY